MRTRFKINAIGSVRVHEGEHTIQLEHKYIPALTNLNGFGHVQVLWWAHQIDEAHDRETLVVGKLFKKGPDRMGVFATRSPVRPNPIMVSTIEISGIDFENGFIRTPFIDAADGSPVLDIKPYYPMERVKNVQAPDWCRHWPQWQEEAEDFNWADEINFR